MLALLTDAQFLGYALCSALASAMFFSFLGGAPHVVVTLMGRSSAEYGIWFAIAAFGYMLGNFGTARLSQRFGIDAMIWWGMAILIAASVATIALIIWAPQWGPATIFVPQIFIAFGSCLLLPNAIAGAVSVRPQSAGTASGVTGFLQMGIGAAAAQGVSHLLANATTAMPMALVMLVFGIAAAIAFVALVKRPSAGQT